MGQPPDATAVAPDDGAHQREVVQTLAIAYAFVASAMIECRRTQIAIGHRGVDP